MEKASVGATALGVLAILFWSTTIACSRSLTEQLGTFTAAATIYLAAGLVGCGALAVRGQFWSMLRQAHRGYLIGCGSMMAAYTTLLYLAVGLAQSRDQIVAVTMANYLWPSLTLLFSIPLLGWKARPWRFGLGTLLGWTGVALAVGVDDLQPLSRLDWSAHAISTGPALLAAVAWGLYSNLSRRWGSKAAAGAMPVFLLATGIFLLLVRLFWEEQPRWTGRVMWEVAYLALFPTLLAYVFWDRAARRGDLSLVAALGYLTPLLSVGVSGVYLGLSILPMQWLAGVLVVAGAVLCKLSIRT